MSARSFCWTLVLLMIPVSVSAQGAPTSGEPVRPPTWSGDVAKIIYDNCTSCHRPGESAPFPLTSYAETKKRALMIQHVTEDRLMPPWHPAKGHGEFLDEMRLSDAEIATLRRWVEAEMPEGDPKSAPKAPTYPAGWQLGEPDMVVTMSEEFQVPAGGPDIYRNFVIPLNLKEDKWVKAVEVRPAARTVVHHVLFFLDDTGSARELDKQDKTPGFRSMGFRRTGSLGGWAVGGIPRKLPGDLAMALPKGSDLILASHFHPSGKAERERTTIGLYFQDKPPSKTLTGFQVPPAYGALANINIPAGEKAYTVKQSFKLPCDIELVSVGAHAHYLGKSMTATATLPDGTVKKLFHIPDWDFNWQTRYTYKERVKLPKGTVVHATVVFDNSADNPHNPSDPPKRVKWGLQSTDEMGSVIFSCVMGDEKDLALFRAADQARKLNRRARDRLKVVLQQLRSMDRNGDKVVSADELVGPWKRALDRLDLDGSGAIEFSEIELAESRLFGGDSKRKPKPKPEPKSRPEPKTGKKRFF